MGLDKSDVISLLLTPAAAAAAEWCYIASERGGRSVYKFKFGRQLSGRTHTYFATWNISFLKIVPREGDVTCSKDEALL